MLGDPFISTLNSVEPIFTVPEGNTACLDGSTSYDPDGDALTYAWMQLDGPTVTLDSPTTSGPCFDTPNVGPGGADLHFQLIVTDSHSASSDPAAPTATVLVHVSYVNQPPTANPGNDQTVNEGDTVSLNGSGTDPDNNTLTFAWSQFSGPTVTLSDPTDPKATFIAPQVFCAGDIIVMTLTADDGYGGTDSKNVTINVANVNHLPTANTGENQQVQEGDAVELHGTGGDADTEEVSSLVFQWTQTSGTPVALSGSGKDVSFTAPNIPGGDPNASVELGFSLTVMDSCGGSTTTDPIIVHVANIPHAPVAVVQQPAPANEGANTVQLDGSSSYDPDVGDTITFAWTQCGGPAVTLVYGPGDPSGIMPTFMTPWVSADTQLKFKLTVTDNWGLSSSACMEWVKHCMPNSATTARTSPVAPMRRSAATAICWPIWFGGCWRTARIRRSWRSRLTRPCRCRICCNVRPTSSAVRMLRSIRTFRCRAISFSRGGQTRADSNSASARP